MPFGVALEAVHRGGGAEHIRAPVEAEHSREQRAQEKRQPPQQPRHDDERPLADDRANHLPCNILRAEDREE